MAQPLRRHLRRVPKGFLLLRIINPRGLLSKERETLRNQLSESQIEVSRLEGSLKAHIDLDESPAAELTAHADATWGDRNVYGLLLTFAGGAVLHQTKKIALIVDSSMESEAIASSKGGETIAYAREVLRGLGIAAGSATLLTTDNLANQKVGSGLGCPTRSRHFLRRYHALKQRIAEGEVTLRYIPDEHMPADFLTKWIPLAKLEKSIVYATNSRASGATARRADDPNGSGGVSAVGPGALSE